MITIVRCGKMVDPKTNAIRLFFLAPEYAEKRKKGFVDMKSPELAQKLLEGGDWSPYCVKPKQGINAMVVAVALNSFVSPSIREFERAFSPNEKCWVVLHHDLSHAEMLEIEQLEGVRKHCAPKVA